MTDQPDEGHMSLVMPFVATISNVSGSQRRGLAATLRKGQ
jgi:hypothetical protein